MATALIAAIQRAHPDSSCTLLTSPPFLPLFKAWPNLTVKAFPRRGVAAMVATLRWIRAQAYDRVYDLQGNDRSGLLCGLSGIRERVGNHARYPYHFHPADPWTGQCHIFERMNEMLAVAGVAPAPARPLLPCTEEELRSVQRFCAGHGLIDRHFVLLHAGASPGRRDKCWPWFGALAARLEESGLRVVWLGAGSDRDINSELAADAGIDATDCFTIPQLAALASRARFAVTNDSGPMHACAAAGIPVVGLFGPTDWRRNHALGQREHVVACTSLVPTFDGQSTGDCLGRMTVEMVWARLLDQGLVTGS